MEVRYKEERLDVLKGGKRNPTIFLRSNSGYEQKELDTPRFERSSLTSIAFYRKPRLLQARCWRKHDAVKTPGMNDLLRSTD
jgi:hypothetical protein